MNQEIQEGDVVRFLTFSPEKKENIRTVITKNGELWAGEVPIELILMDDIRRNLVVLSRKHEYCPVCESIMETKPVYKNARKNSFIQTTCTSCDFVLTTHTLHNEENLSNQTRIRY